MTEGSEQYSLLLEDASGVPGAPDGAARALVEAFGLPFPVAQRILASLPALVLKDQPADAADDMAGRLRAKGFVVRVRGPGRGRVDVMSGGHPAAGDVPLVGIRRRTTGAHATVRDSGSISAIGRRSGSTGAHPALAERTTGQRAAVLTPLGGAAAAREDDRAIAGERASSADSGGFAAVREAAVGRPRTTGSQAVSARSPEAAAGHDASPFAQRHTGASHALAGPADQTPLPFDEPRRRPEPVDDAFSFDRLAEDLPPLDAPPTAAPARRGAQRDVPSEAVERSAEPVTAPRMEPLAAPGSPDVRSRLLDEMAALDQSGISAFATGTSFSLDAEVDGPAAPPARPRAEPPPLDLPPPVERPALELDMSFGREEPSVRRRDPLEFERAEVAVRTQPSSTHDAAARTSQAETAGERPKIQFEAAVGSTNSSMEDDLKALSGLYDSEPARSGSGPRGPNAAGGVGARTTGAHAVIGGRPTGSHAAVVAQAAPERRGGGAGTGAVWKLALGIVGLIVMGVVAQQVAARGSRGGAFERASRLFVITADANGRTVERACMDEGEGRFLCRYNVDHYVLAFPSIERPVAELAASQCTAEGSDDGQSLAESMVCRLQWVVAGEEREYLLARRQFRSCDRSLTGMQPGDATTCELTLETEARRGTASPDSSRSTERRMLRMEQSRATLNTPAGYIDAIEFVSTPVDPGVAGGTRVVHYAPSLHAFVREAAFGAAPQLQLTYRREPGREDGSWSGAD